MGLRSTDHAWPLANDCHKHEMSRISTTQMAKENSRNIVGITRKDKIANEKVKRKTGIDKLENIMRKKRLQWCRHVKPMYGRGAYT